MTAPAIEQWKARALAWLVTRLLRRPSFTAAMRRAGWESKWLAESEVRHLRHYMRSLENELEAIECDRFFGMHDTLRSTWPAIEREQLVECDVHDDVVTARGKMYGARALFYDIELQRLHDMRPDSMGRVLTRLSGQLAHAIAKGLMNDARPHMTAWMRREVRFR